MPSLNEVEEGPAPCKHLEEKDSEGRESLDISTLPSKIFLNPPPYEAYISDGDPDLDKLSDILNEWGSPSPPTPSGEPAKLLEHLFLGSANDCVRPKVLRGLGITHIVNTVEHMHPTRKDFEKPGPNGEAPLFYLGFSTEDQADFDMRPMIPPTLEVLKRAKEEGGKVVIHCMAGVNRSGFLAIVCVAKALHCDVVSAARYVNKRRFMVLQNLGFRKQLIEWGRSAGYGPRTRGLRPLPKEEGKEQRIEERW